MAAPLYIELGAGTELHHVHRPRFAATAFNPNTGTELYRFSPFKDARGEAVPSWYGSTHPHGALYETVFREVVSLGLPAIDASTVLAGRVISRVRLARPARLIQLYGDGLVRLRLPTSLTTGGPETYAGSIETARELHDRFPDSHGFIWLSRINNQELSLVLYGDRLDGDFGAAGSSEPLDKQPALQIVMDAANRIGCEVT